MAANSKQYVIGKALKDGIKFAISKFVMAGGRRDRTKVKAHRRSHPDA